MYTILGYSEVDRRLLIWQRGQPASQRWSLVGPWGNYGYALSSAAPPPGEAGALDRASLSHLPAMPNTDIFVSEDYYVGSHIFISADDVRCPCERKRADWKHAIEPPENTWIRGMYPSSIALEKEAARREIQEQEGRRLPGKGWQGKLRGGTDQRTQLSLTVPSIHADDIRKSENRKGRMMRTR
jgi:hypothetical protein